MKKTKKNYVKPKIKSEKLLSYGALCGNKKQGTAGGRKASTGAPNFCNASKLLS